MATPVLETKRLTLRPLQLSDAAEVQRLFPRWEIVKYLNARVPWPFPEDGVHMFYRDSTLPAMERGDEWHWMLRLKNDPEERILGSVSLVLHGDVNRGFWMAQEWQGRGLMTEAVDAVTRFWFEELKQPYLRVKKARDNVASRAISVHQGMRCVAEIEDDYVCGRLPAERWELSADDWRKKRLSDLKS